MNKESLKWDLTKELAVYEGDLKLLKKIQSNFDKVKDYDGKTVNKYLENRIKKIDDTLYIKEKWSGASKNSYTIDCFKKYTFETNHGHEISDTTLVFYLQSPDNKFDFENFKEIVEGRLRVNESKVEGLKKSLDNIDSILERYNEIYKSILDFKKENDCIKSHFTKFSTFYNI